jgi:hypothetical protein
MPQDGDDQKSAESQKRILLLKARKKLCVLSNAGSVANHHALANVRRNSLVLKMAAEKMEAWKVCADQLRRIHLCVF